MTPTSHSNPPERGGLRTPFYDPGKTYEENFEEGPFGLFADGEVFERDGEPRTSFLGQKVFSPFGIPAGPLINGRFVKAALDKGFDLAVYKTVRTRSRPCPPWPNVLAVEVDGDLTPGRGEKGLVAGHVYGLPLAVANSFHVPSPDPDVWQEDMADAVGHARAGQVVIGSFQGTIDEDSDANAYIKDFATVARLVQETGARILEANLSCPGPGGARLLCSDLELTRKVLEAVRNEIGDTPLIAKIPYFGEHELAGLVATLAPFIQGVSAINTIPSRIVDSGGEPAWPGEGRTTGGVGGAPIRWAGLDMTGRLKGLREENGSGFAVIGVGGVTTPEDYNRYKACGADAVMSATGAMWNPLLARECLF